MSRWLHLLCWLALAAGAVAAEPGMLLEGKATAVARDRDATLWSIDGSGGNVIATLDGARWLSHAVVGLNEHVRPVSLATLPDGDVGCLWEDHSESDDSWAVTRHRAGKSWLWVRFHATLRDPALLGRRDGSAIVTESGRSVVLLAADANPATVTTLAEGNFVTPKKNDDGSESSDFAPVRAVEDRSGCLWLWNPGQVRQSWKWHLAGLVRWDPASPAERLCRIGKGEPPISQVVAWDEQRIALAVAGTGPFFAPNDGSKFEPMPTPDADAFRYVEQFFHDGSAWHAVTTPQPTDYKVENSAIQSRIAFRVLRFYDVSKPVCALWKYSDEHWSRIFDGLDKDPAASPRPWLRMATGLFLGSDQSAPWFFPAAPDAKPRRLVPAQLFPLPRTAQMAEADATRVLLLGGYDGKSLLWPADAPEPPDREPRWEAVTTRHQALQDVRGRIWCIRPDGTFARWENARWIPSAMPADLRPSFTGFNADDRDRGWLLPVEGEQTAICDFANGEWRVFPTLQEALQAQLPRGVKIAVPEHPYYEPAFSGDGRIGAFAGLESVQLFEAGKWHKWKITDILGSDARLTATPFFAEDGFFSIPIGANDAWQWQGSAGWKLRDDTPVPGEGTSPRRPKFETGGMRIATGAQDRLGVIWWLRNGAELCKTVWGRTVPVFSAEESNPFQLGGAIHAALADDLGNALLATSEFREDCEHVFIHPRLPVPRTSARLLEVRDDTAAFALGAEPAEGAWFTYRLDGGVWQPAQDGAEFRINALVAGLHRLEARAWNADLTPDAKGTAVSFRVEFETQALLRKLLAQLAADDLDQREAAARSLIALGRAALPAIEVARRDAASPLRWWLDAVTEAIERARPADR